MDVKLLIRRILARMIDLIVLYVIISILLSLTRESGFIRMFEAITSGIEISTDDKFQGLIYTVYLLLFVFVWSIAFIYEGITTSTIGLTLGKAITSLQVVQIDSHKLIGIWRSAGRWLLIWSWITFIVWVPAEVKVIFLFVSVVACIVTWSRTRQFPHDCIVDTVVEPYRAERRR